jgi:hypothetical protein
MDAGRQYTQNELPGDVFNKGDGDVVDFNGGTYKIKNNGNGTRSFSPYVDTSAYDSLLAGAPKAADYAQGLNANENDAFNNYFNYVASQPTPLDFYNQIAEQQGIPQMRQTQKTLQGQVFDLEDTLRRVEPDVTATTGQSIVTEAQRRGMVTERQKPLVENLGWLGQSLGRVSGAITEANQQALNLTQLNEQGAQKMIDAFKTKLELATQQGTRALQAFIHDTDQVVSITLAKIARKEKVSDDEANRAFEMLKLQKTAELNMQAENAKTNTEVVEAGGRKLLIDKNTGKTIADLGSSKSGAAAGTGFATSYYDDDGGSEWELMPSDIYQYNQQYFMG